MRKIKEISRVEFGAVYAPSQHKGHTVRMSVHEIEAAKRKRAESCFHLPHEATFPKGEAASFVATLAANVRRGFHGIDTILVAGSPTYIVEKGKQFGTETSIESAYAKCDNQEDLGNLIKTAKLDQREEDIVDTKRIKSALKSTKEVFKSGLLNRGRDLDGLNPGEKCLMALRDGTEGAEKTLIFGNRFKKVAEKDKPTDYITVHGKKLESTTAKPYYVTDGEVLKEYYPGETIKTLSSGACDKVINEGKELPKGPKYKVTWGSTLAKRKANIKKLEEKLGSDSGISFGAVTPEDECDATFASACRVLDAYAVSLAIEGRSLPVKIGLFSVGGSCVHVAVYKRVGEHNYNRIDMPVIEEKAAEKPEEKAAENPEENAAKKARIFAPFTEQTLHHATQTKMYALMGSFADEREISNQHELVTAFHDFVTSGKFETSGYFFDHATGEMRYRKDEGYKIGRVVKLKGLVNSDTNPNVESFNNKLAFLIPRQKQLVKQTNFHFKLPAGKPTDFKQKEPANGDPQGKARGYYKTFEDPAHDDIFGKYWVRVGHSNDVLYLDSSNIEYYNGPNFKEGQETRAPFAEAVQPPASKTSCNMLGVPSRGGKKVAL